MLEFLSANLATILISLVLIAIVTAIIISMVKNRKKMVKALHIALQQFTAAAAWALSVKMVKKRATSWNIGFPGG